MKIAAFYARVSTSNQQKEQTIESQIEEIKQRIKADGNTLSPTCEFKDDGWSGANLDRPGLDAMRNAITRGEFQVLYVYDRGRLARRYVYQEVVLDELKKYNIEFVTLHDRKAETPEDSILQGMEGLFQEYERIKTMERTKRGKLHKARSGFIVNGPASYGYNYIPKTPSKQSHWIVNEQEADVVRKIFHWVADEGSTIYGVVKRLDQEGIIPRKRKRNQWGKSTVARLLKNEAFIGKAYYNKHRAIEPKHPMKTGKYRRNKKTSRELRSRDEWLVITVPRIIDDDLFNRAQEQLQQNYRFAARSKKRFYFLTGVIYCECGSRMTGEFVAGHLYYRCTNRLKHQPLPRHCVASGLNVRRVDTVVWDQFQRLLTDPQTLRRQAERWLQGKQVGLEEFKRSRLDDIEHQLTSLLEQEKRHADSYAQELISSFEVFKSLMDTIKLKRAALTNELNQLQYELHKSNPYSNITVDEVMRRAPKTIKHLIEQDKRDIVLALTDKIIIDYDRKEAKVFGFLPLPEHEEIQNSVNESFSRNHRFT